MFGKLTEMATPFVEEQIQNLTGGNDENESSGERAVEGAASMTQISENATRKALFVGINYFGTSAELRGCINDIENISEWLFSRGFSPENSIILRDDSEDSSKLPTRENIINGMKWLVDGAKAGDSLFFEYSGHGGTAKDTDGDEQDAQDETICPMDYQESGQILDDEMNTILVKNLPPGCHLTCIYDSCHSGSALDLPFTYTIDGNLEVQVRDNTKAMMKCAMDAGMSFAKGNKAEAMSALKEGFGFAKDGGLQGLYAKATGGEPPAQGDNKEEIDAAREKMRKEKGTDADVVQLAGCKDAQTSADACIEGSHAGAMSHAFMETMNNNPNLSYTDLLRGLREILAGKYTQIPQMSTGKLADMDSPFSI